MSGKLPSVLAAIEYIEGRLDRAPSLDAIARAAGRSKFYLHRAFVETVGATMHGYLRRRQLTEAARLLVTTEAPILDIALGSGYESQQAFTSAFKALYKESPARFRAGGFFYPLQLRFRPWGEPEVPALLGPLAVARAAAADIPGWLDLVRAAVGGFPRLDEAECAARLGEAVGAGRAFVLKGGRIPAGAMICDRATGRIEFLAVHPQLRDRGAERALLRRAMSESACPELSVTTFREGDKADTGYRESVRRLGFLEGEPLVEFGYPTQRFTLRRAAWEASR